MSSRMSKYYEEPENLVTRSIRHEELYKDINKSELENYSIKSNATVLGENNNINVDKIKKILDNRYNEGPKRKSIQIEEYPEEVIEREDTKEYDINLILEKAKEAKPVSYEEERLKKLRDTQYDILNTLNVVKEKEEIKENDNLADLINTITFNEVKKTTDPLDILTDLKGEDDTVLIGNNEENDIIDNDKTATAKDLVDSFYTKSNMLNSKDFDDSEFSDVDEKMNTFVKIIISIVILAFIAGILIILKLIFF